MTCATCGAPTFITDQSGATKEGQFTEEYECVYNHKGTIRGRAEDPPQEWQRTGRVFND